MEGRGKQGRGNTGDQTEREEITKQRRGGGGWGWQKGVQDGAGKLEGVAGSRDGGGRRDGDGVKRAKWLSKAGRIIVIIIIQKGTLEL